MKGIYNFLALTDRLSTSGMPKPEQLRDVAQAGVQFVINLATPKSEGWIVDEEALVRGLGMEYLSIPVDWENPTAQNLQDFLEAMDAHAGEHVLVHCQANYRATAFTCLYRILRLGWSREAACADLGKIWDPGKYPVWEKFLNEQIG